MADVNEEATDTAADETSAEQMCCKDGMTAAEHRAKSPNGKCCTD